MSNFWLNEQLLFKLAFFGWMSNFGVNEHFLVKWAIFVQMLTLALENKTNYFHSISPARVTKLVWGKGKIQLSNHKKLLRGVIGFCSSSMIDLFTFFVADGKTIVFRNKDHVIWFDMWWAIFHKIKVSILNFGTWYFLLFCLVLF